MISPLYLSLHGDSQLGFSLTDVAMRLGITVSAMNMRISNFRSLESPGHLGNATKQTRNVFDAYRNGSELELRSMVLGILMRAAEECR